MPNKPPIEGPKVVDAPDESALFTPDYVKRIEPMIPIQKNELRMMSSFNAIATICFSMANGIGFLGVGFLWDALADGQIIREEWPWLIFALLGLLFFAGGGGWSLWRRKADFDYIWKRAGEG